MGGQVGRGKLSTGACKRKLHVQIQFHCLFRRFLLRVTSFYQTQNRLGPGTVRSLLLLSAGCNRVQEEGAAG